MNLRLPLYLALILAFLAQKGNSQCTIYPVQEAVVNGNFETPVANPPTEFQLDGYWPLSIMNDLKDPTKIAQTCYYATKNAYWVGSTADSFYCENVKKFGFGFCPGCFAITGDHTPGLAGKGHFLAVDTWADNAGPGTRISPIGSQPIVWQQTVNVYPGQTYYFSAWAANWGPTPYADLRFFVQGNNDAVPVQLGAAPFSVPSPPGHNSTRHGPPT